MTTTAPAEDSRPTIRRAREADLSAVHRIEQASFPQPWPYAAFERYLDEPGFLVAEAVGGEGVDGAADSRDFGGAADDGVVDGRGVDGGAVVGYVIADSIPNHGTPLAHVKDIAVAEGYRDRGIGSTLLTRALDLLADAGAETAKLEVRESNADAIRLYERFDFEHSRRIRGYYGNGEDAIVMVHELE